MPQFEMWLLLILLTAVANLERGATQCTSNNGVTDAGRQDALKAINDVRRTAVNGLLQNGATAGDNLPHGKNMYKLEWDCGLESLAEILLTQDCAAPATVLPNNGIGAHVVTPAPANVDAVITGAVAAWPPLLQANAIATPAAVTDPVVFQAPANANPAPDLAALQPLINMIQDKATKVGCTAKLCAGGANPSLAVCVYDVPAVAQQGVIYERGNGVCTAASAATECTTYTPSTCDIATGLCLKTDATTTAATTTAAAATTPSASSVVTPSGGTNTRCSQNSGMIDELRFLFRDMHNYRRSQTALGKTMKNTGRYLPQGSNMQFMRYDCNLEASAIQLAAVCPSAATQSGRIIGQLPVSSVATWTDAVREIVKSWWRVVRQYNGPGMQVTFKTQHVGTPIASFTQMAWAASRKLGCAVARCSTVYVGVCNYNPSGNIVNQQIYTPGTPCSSCTAGATCTANEGLCTLP